MSDDKTVGELVAQIVVLSEIERTEALQDVQDVYGRNVADRVRKSVCKQLAKQDGLVIGWDGDNFTGIGPERIGAWKKAWPGINIDVELGKARNHLLDNPGKIKSEYGRFLSSWFKRALTSYVQHRRSTGKLTQTEVANIFVQQHEATRICQKVELQQHLSRQPVGARYLVDWLFDDCLLRYGNQFSSRWIGLDVHDLKAQWAAELGKLALAEIKAGVVRMRRECISFPPTLQEFVHLCRPAESIENLFLQCASLAARHLVDHATPWPSAVLYWAAQRFGMGSLSGANWVASKTRFTQIYHDCLAQQDEGSLPNMPAAVPRISGPQAKQRTEAGSQALAAAKALLGVKRGAVANQEAAAM